MPLCLAASSKERADYLEVRTKAQFLVPEGDLLKAVREVLARHGALPQGPSAA